MSDKKLRITRSKTFGTFTASFLLLSCLTASFSQAGIFGPSTDTKKCAAEIKKLAPQETKILSRYAAVTGPNFKSDLITGQALVALIPDVNIFIGQLDSITPRDSKFQTALNTYIQAWNDYAQGMELVLGAIQASDYSKVAAANQDLSLGRSLEKQASISLAPFLK